MEDFINVISWVIGFPFLIFTTGYLGSVLVIAFNIKLKKNNNFVFIVISLIFGIIAWILLAIIFQLIKTIIFSIF
jgi:hypothetical protein